MNAKCPYHHNWSSEGFFNDKSWTVDATTSPTDEVRRRFRLLMEWGQINIDSPEWEQAYFAFQIAQLGNELSRMHSQMSLYLSEFDNSEASYKDIVDELWIQLKKIWRNFWLEMDVPENFVNRLVAWLETFHSFMKRAVLFSELDIGGNRIFPYQKAVQLASTHIERANYMARNPDILAWDTIFFDLQIDTSKQFLGYPVSERPLYRCPVLHSWKFREFIDMYFSILCQAWEQSSDRPKIVDWSNHDV